MNTSRHTGLPPILLVEDNPMDLDLTLRAFSKKKLSNHVIVARDGEEALAHIPRWEDGEKTIEELRGRVQKALDLLATYAPSDLNGLDDKVVTFKQAGADVQMPAAAYLLDNVLPHFYFHVTTAYAILRHNGVPVGKRDFVG